MKRYLSIILTAAMLLFAANVSSGYDFIPVHGGPYWVNGDGWYYVRTCDRCGQYGYQRYSQIPHYQAPATAAEKPAAYSPGWRDTYIQTLERMNDRAAYDAAIARLPLPPAQPQTVQQNYLRPGLHVSSIYGSTQYGYPSTVNSINAEGERVKYQSLMADFGKSLADGTNAANALNQAWAETLSRGAAADAEHDAENRRTVASLAAIVAVANNPRKTQTKVNVQPDPVADPALPPLGAAAKTAAAPQATPPEALAMVKIIKTSCVSCHSGPTPAKGFDVLRSIGVDDNEKFQAAAEKISGVISRGEMPLAADRKTAKPLSPEQIKAIQAGLTSLGAQLSVAEAE